MREGCVDGLVCGVEEEMNGEEGGGDVSEDAWAALMIRSLRRGVEVEDGDLCRAVRSLGREGEGE